MLEINGYHYYTPLEVSKLLCIDVTAIRKYCVNGKIRAVKHYIVSRNQFQWGITEEALNEYKKNRIK